MNAKGAMALAVVFPGQGSQSVGMLAALAAREPQIRATFAEASDALGRDLWQLAQTGPEAELNRTEVTQPLMLAAGVAVWRAWRARGGAVPVILAGHSLGEYTALVCAEGLAFDDAVRLVADRARYMQEAVPAGTGAMAALLGVDDAAARNLCTQAAEGEVLAPVNFNSPGQIVIAGAATAVARAIEQAKSVAGAKRAVLLPVSVPSHCALMAPAATRMAARLLEVSLSLPKIPVVHNYDADITANVEDLRSALVRQVEAPVRWVETVQKIAAMGATALLECGPGAVLTGLNKRIDKQIAAFALGEPTGFDEALAATGPPATAI